MVLAVVDDLLFSSKIRAAAKAIDQPTVFVRRRADVAAALREHRPHTVVIDLDRDALDPIGVIHDLQADADRARLRVIGFASHVHADRLRLAREAGCDRVLARSGFVADLPALLRPPAATPDDDRARV